MPVIDIKKSQNGILADAINAVSHDIAPEDHPEPLTGEQIIIYGAYEDYSTNWWGWWNAKQVTLGPNPSNLLWPDAGTHKFKFEPAKVWWYFDGHIDLSFLNSSHFVNGNITSTGRELVRDAFTGFCDDKGINWRSLFSDIQPPRVAWVSTMGAYYLEMLFTANVVMGPVYLSFDSSLLD